MSDLSKKAENEYQNQTKRSSAPIQFFNNLQLGVKLFLSFIVLIVFTLVLGVVSFMTTQAKSQALDRILAAQRVVDNVEEIESTFLEIRNLEKTYFQNYKLIGFRSANQLYIDPLREHLQVILNLIAEQRVNETTEGGIETETMENLVALEDIALAYDDAFSRLIDRVEQRGFKDVGLEGSFQEFIHTLETEPIIQNNPELLILLLSLRRREKDWILRQDTEYVVAVRSLSEKLKKGIIAAESDPAKQAQWVGLIDQYLEQFAQLVELDGLILQDTNTIQVVTRPIPRLASEIIANERAAWQAALAEHDNLERLAQNINLAVQVAIILLGIGFAVAITQNVAGRIATLTNFAKHAATGELSQRLPVTSSDEIGQLTTAVNEMASQLGEFISGLEAQVQERTADLTLSIEVGQKAVAIRETDELLTTITEFIQQQFDLYYVQVYFVDDIGQNLILKSGSGEVGTKLLAQKHSLPLDTNSVVGSAASQGKSFTVSDVRQSSVHRPNPLLPNTHSEAALPLIVEDRVMGVLDMQADKSNTFSAENLAVFEAMATQLAISIDSAQQWTIAQESRHRAEDLAKHLIRDAWEEKLGTTHNRLGYSYDLSSTKPLNGDTEGDFSVPIIVQNQAIGRLTVDMSDNQFWNEETYIFLSTISQQLAQKAENLRLFEQTQHRASREQLTRQITDKIRAANDIEAALDTAAAELNRVLGTAKAVVNLKMQESPVDNTLPRDLVEPNGAK